MVVNTLDIMARAAGLVAASDDLGVQRGVTTLRDALAMGGQYCLTDSNVAVVAHSILAASSDPAFQRGIALLAVSCGADVRLPELTQQRVIFLEPAPSMVMIDGEVAR